MKKTGKSRACLAVRVGGKSTRSGDFGKELGMLCFKSENWVKRYQVGGKKGAGSSGLADELFLEKKGNWLFGASRRIRMFEKKGSWLIRACRRISDPRPVARLKASRVSKVEQGRDEAGGRELEGKTGWAEPVDGIWIENPVTRGGEEGVLFL